MSATPSRHPGQRERTEELVKLLYGRQLELMTIDCFMNTSSQPFPDSFVFGVADGVPKVMRSRVGV